MRINFLAYNFCQKLISEINLLLKPMTMEVRKYWIVEVWKREISELNKEEKQISEPVIERDIDCKGIDIVNLVKSVFARKCTTICTKTQNNGYIFATANFTDYMRNKEVTLNLEIEYDTFTIYQIKLSLLRSEDNLTDYTTDLKLYYYENFNIYKFIQEIRAENDTPNTVRIYKLMYNSYPIKGTYSFHLKNCSVMFHTLAPKERAFPYTEHIVAFDVKVKSHDIQEARAKAYDIVSDFASYLSVLLDIGFYEPHTIYKNFVTLSHDSYYQRYISHNRYKTSFIDKELNLVVQDNMNGLATLQDVKKGINFGGGSISITASDEDSENLIESYGNISHVKEILERHRLEKVPNLQPEYMPDIKEDLFILGQKILIPRCIRKYYKGIEALEEPIQKAFRNCCRLYNKSMIIGVNEPSLQIAFFVVCIESLAKAEKSKYSDFMKKYCIEASKRDIDDMYDIRSKLFHSGEFSFFEFETNMNPYLNPAFEYFSTKYDQYRKIIRKTIVTWIKSNVIKECDTIGNIHACEKK